MTQLDLEHLIGAEFPLDEVNEPLRHMRPTAISAF